jgi:DNA-binding NarL/FixJ family response regulator
MIDRIKILVIEDQFFFRLALRSIVDARNDMIIVAEASKAREALPLYKEHRPELAIIDLRLPEGSGLEAIAAIRQHDAKARLLVLSNYEGSEDIHRALRAGALAYLTKDAGGEDLVQAILTVAQGKRYLSPTVAATLSARVAGDDLTDRERNVLQLLAQGCSNREISSRLKIAENTVRIHVSHILDKLQVEDRTQAVLAAIHRGLVHVE